MPIVRVSMFEGRSLAKKRQMVEGITAIVAEVCEIDQAGVHVLIDEMSRDNWARGGTLHRDRGPKAGATSSFARTTFRSISWVTVVQGREDEYLAYRRDHVNPRMGQMPGFLGTLTAQDMADKSRFLILNHWENEDAWRAYQRTPAHDQLRDKIRGELTEEMIIGRYVTIDLPLGDGLDTEPNAARYMTVSTHHVKTNETEVYLSLRKGSVHPAMAEFHGFVSSNAMESLDQPYAFLIVNTWMSKDEADAYGSSAAHNALRDQVRALLSEHSGTHQYEFVTV